MLTGRFQRCRTNSYLSNLSVPLRGRAWMWAQKSTASVPLRFSEGRYMASVSDYCIAQRRSPLCACCCRSAGTRRPAVNGWEPRFPVFPESRRWIDGGSAKVSYAGPIPKGSPQPIAAGRQPLVAVIRTTAVLRKLPEGQFTLIGQNGHSRIVLVTTAMGWSPAIGQEISLSGSFLIS